MLWVCCQCRGVAANTSDNVGGVTIVDRARCKYKQLKKISHDSGFKRTFTSHCVGIGLTTEHVTRISPDTFEVLPHRWVAEHTQAWLINHRHLQINHEHDPVVTAGLVSATHTRTLLRHLTHPNHNPTTSTQ